MTNRLPPLPSRPPSPFGLFLDVDGSLVDLAARPEQVVVVPELKQGLMILAERLDGAVALISGRTIANLDQLFDPLRLLASGVHGAEWRLRPDAGVETADEATVPKPILAGMAVIAADHAGTFVEDKRYSAAIHYRANPEAGTAIAQALRDLVATSESFRVLSGHRVFEIKHAGFDKGTAVERFMAHAPFAGRMPVFIGDDVTDEPGLAAVAARGGIACAVGGERQGATHVIETPADVRRWLVQLAADPAAA